MSLLLLFHPGATGAPPPPPPGPDPTHVPGDVGGAIGRNTWREHAERRRALALLDEQDLLELARTAAAQLALDHLNRNRRH